MVNNENFKRGTIELVVLAVLRQKDMYGYEIVKALSEKSNGNYTTPIGTLYPVLYRFVENGYISAWDEIVSKRLRKYYHLEEKGERYYCELLEEYQKNIAGVEMIIKDGDGNE